MTRAARVICPLSMLLPLLRVLLSASTGAPPPHRWDISPSVQVCDQWNDVVNDADLWNGVVAGKPDVLPPPPPLSGDGILGGTDVVPLPLSEVPPPPEIVVPDALRARVQAMYETVRPYPQLQPVWALVANLRLALMHARGDNLRIIQEAHDLTAACTAQQDLLTAGLTLAQSAQPFGIEFFTSPPFFEVRILTPVEQVAWYAQLAAGQRRSFTPADLPFRAGHSVLILILPTPPYTDVNGQLISAPIPVDVTIVPGESDLDPADAVVTMLGTIQSMKFDSPQGTVVSRGIEAYTGAGHDDKLASGFDVVITTVTGQEIRHHVGAPDAAHIFGRPPRRR